DGDAAELRRHGSARGGGGGPGARAQDVGGAGADAAPSGAPSRVEDPEVRDASSVRHGSGGRIPEERRRQPPSGDARADALGARRLAAVHPKIQGRPQDARRSRKAPYSPGGEEDDRAVPALLPDRNRLRPDGRSQGD